MVKLQPFYSRCCAVAAFCLLILLVMPLYCRGAEQPVGVLLSREIGPFVAMVEGLESGLGSQSVERFFLDRTGQPYSLSGATLDSNSYRALVAVGPKALSYLQENVGDLPLLYGMVLNPGNILKTRDNLCGVSLNIPVAAQFSALQKHFPWLHRLGILFDPANNQAWYDDASVVAESLNLELIPLHVERSGGRLKIVGDLNSPDALLFIPDKTIISKAIIQHVIKQGVLRGVPAVGYNRFFLDSGAALSFVIRYKQIGELVARQLFELGQNGSCQSLLPPAFDTEVNPDIWQALQLDEREGER